MIDLHDLKARLLSQNWQNDKLIKDYARSLPEQTDGPGYLLISKGLAALTGATPP